MESSQENKPSQHADALAIVLRLREAGYVAYFAGGCVRDTLLGGNPKDYDVATNAEPARVRKLFPNTQAVGAAFGVILVRQGKSVIEVATFRADGPYSDGRRPDQVRFATAEEDAQRRDFTINGLFLDPVENKVIDFVGGREDLAQKRLRAIGEAARRFEEDHLRMLRAVRFVSRFDLTIEPATAAAIRKAAARLKGISPERIAEELRLTLTPVTRRRAWPLLWELELGPVIFRLLPGGVPAGAGDDTLRSIFLAIDPNEPIEFGLALAAAVLELNVGVSGNLPVQLERPAVHDSAAAMRKALRISNEEFDAMEGTLAGLGPLLATAEPTVAVKKRFLAQPTAGLSRKLLAALASTGWLPDRANALAGEFAIMEKMDFAPLPLLTGDDLTAAGLTPGPLFKRLLDSTYDAQLEGKIATRQEALAMAMKSSKCSD